MSVEIVKVGRKNTITIKKNLRNALNIEPGRLLIAEVSGDTLSLRPLPRDPFQRLEDLIGDIEGSELARMAEEQLISEAQKSLSGDMAGGQGD